MGLAILDSREMRKLRPATGWPLEVIAAICGCSHQYVQRLEKQAVRKMQFFNRVTGCANRGDAEELRLSVSIAFHHAKPPRRVRKKRPPKSPMKRPIIERRACDPIEAAEYIGGRGLLLEYLAAGWLKPFVQRNRLTRYDKYDLDRCIDRHKLEEPVPLKST